MIVTWDRATLGHAVPLGFPERPERLESILAAWHDDPRFELVEVQGEPDEQAVLGAVESVHDAGYVARLRAAVARGDGLIDSSDNPIGATSFDAALGAARATLRALAVTLDEGRPAFAAVRPPGHHAERGNAMGFCFFGNVAIAAEAALAREGIDRVAIVDVDVHHGNGTQHLFERRADVFYASLHRFPFYPGTGAEQERGVGAGEGATLNCPLPAGSGDEEWLEALEGRVVPELEGYAPDLLLVSAGFDAWAGDPLGGTRVTEAGFARMGEALRRFAEACCGGRWMAVLEGGYDVLRLPALAAAFLVGSAEAG